tara:strand:- start:472 stop:1104 length:633 start_codon:yes stop_codon:yes gene_type:complete
VLFKICGLKEINIIDCCEKKNVDFFGMIFYDKSPRYITLKQAQELVNFSKNKNIKPVGVFVNENLEIVKSFIKNLDLKIVQLHGKENDEYIKEIKHNADLKVIKSIPIKDKKDFRKINNYQSNDYFLLDYKSEKDDLPGGNAKQFDWSLLSDININKPWFLSGGINKSNINKIKNYVNPNGIDLSSGVEEVPGIKSVKMINNLFEKYYVK